ncbi:MAG: efflux RND transporter periplasmic adaptor subunit [Thioalkalispiraceae bacterium]|jgi:multidrug efflux system membrane fusion protein
MNNLIQHVIGLTLLASSHAVLALEFDATTGWANRIVMGSQVSGIVAVVNVSPGQQVKQGDVLMQLDQRLFKARYNKTRAQVASEKEALDEAERELERSLTLYEQTILAEHELQMARNAHKKAEADYKKALAENTHAKLDLEYSALVAPFDAVVLKVLRNKGESINARIETPLMLVIAEAGKMKATGAVSAEQLTGIKTGQSATVTISGKNYTGKVKAIGLEPVQGGKLYPVEVEFATDELIRAGSRASVSL